MKKCFFIDVDGVLTNGTKIYSDNGMPSFKTYYDKDFTALKLLKAMSYDVVLVSGDDFINKRMAENRNIRFISSRNLDKADVIKDYLKKNYNGVDVLTYGIGDDIFDFSMLEFVDIPYCPSDASLYIKQYFENTNGIVLKSKGGEGCIQEISEGLEGYGMNDEIYTRILELDQNEKF